MRNLMELEKGLYRQIGQEIIKVAEIDDVFDRHICEAYYSNGGNGHTCHIPVKCSLGELTAYRQCCSYGGDNYDIGSYTLCVRTGFYRLIAVGIKATSNNGSVYRYDPAFPQKLGERGKLTVVEV